MGLDAAKKIGDLGFRRGSSQIAVAFCALTQTLVMTKE